MGTCRIVVPARAARVTLLSVVVAGAASAALLAAAPSGAAFSSFEAMYSVTLSYNGFEVTTVSGVATSSKKSHELIASSLI